MSQELSHRVAEARRIAVVGNGGIAMELVFVMIVHTQSRSIQSINCHTYASLDDLNVLMVCCRHGVKSCDVLWVLKDRHIGAAYLDEISSAFLLPRVVRQFYDG